MIAGQHKFDETDNFLHANIGQWLCVRWQEGLFRAPQGVAYGTHIAGYIVCDHQNGIKSLNIAWMYLDQTGRLFRVGDLMEGINCLWFFKYETLKKMEIRLLTNLERDSVGLPDMPPGAEVYSKPELDEIRHARELDEYRHPGYPDDVSVSLRSINIEKVEMGGIEIGGEQVWVRLEKKITRNKYAGVLLNNSNCFGLQSGQAVLVQYIKVNDKAFLFSHVPTPKDEGMEDEGRA